MSLLPLLTRNWWDAWDYPSRIFDQHFGMGLLDSDLLPPTIIVIHGKHEEKTDEHGFVSREFTRRYLLPEGTDPETVKSSLSQNGVLTIEAPKKAIEPPPSNERVVPITMEKPAVKN
ncbi:Protein lethal(2)essential for life like protein [Argiope bruennichi]|uniref:Protein lethal(2)essential for life like protein n=1 Tax=Argiope bruennichi TaxID=94029 RepID=A0A8T0FG52_ARGBR|nr:Protein lethal(2)essential for life like protein [Argiope bruennichi]